MPDVGPERVVGCFAGKPLVVVSCRPHTMARARELTLTGAAPTWFEYDTSVGIERVSTTDPQWFVDLERQIFGR